MAAFQDPADAVAAALDMLAGVEALNRDLGDRNLILRIGLHKKAAIAVTLNDRLDYFGQTVNVAARVQGLADAGEICLTREVHDARPACHPSRRPAGRLGPGSRWTKPSRPDSRPPQPNISRDTRADLSRGLPCARGSVRGNTRAGAQHRLPGIG
jgi:class 3 adenylate cyclase